MRAIFVAAIAGVVVSLFAGCGGTPTQPTHEALLTITVNVPSVITVTVGAVNKGDINISHLAVVVPTRTDVTVSVQSMEGLHTKVQVLNLSGDYTLSLTF